MNFQIMENGSGYIDLFPHVQEIRSKELRRIS